MKYYTVNLAQLIYLLPARYQERLNTVILLDVVDSTNDYLITKKTDSLGINVCIASAQKKGRGRRGNKWLSPSGGNIYLSLSWSLKHVHNDRWYGLAMASSLARYLTSLGDFSVGVKWPNDLYCNGYKLGGILIENTKSKYISGLGLNIVNNKYDSSSLSNGYISLQDLGVDLKNYCSIVSHIIMAMIDAIDCVTNKSIDEMQNIYRIYDLTYDREVIVREAGRTLKGIAVGVDNVARLCLKTSSSIIAYDENDISVTL